MNIQHHASEKGQAIIFLVVGLVVFLGFVALAIDGGMAYADRRESQNSSDSSSLAGAGAAAIYMENHEVTYASWDEGCDNNWEIFHAREAAVQAAINRAAANGFDLNADGNWVETTCGIDNWGWEDRYIDITVHISRTTETSFAHLLFPASLTNQVDSTTRVRPRMPLAFGHAIVALNPADCQGNQNGAIFGGNGQTHIVGGGVWSNGCLRGNGNSWDVTVENGSVSYVGEQSGSEHWTPNPQQAPHTIPSDYFEVPEPDCTGHWVSANDLSGNLDPGLYCVNSNVNLDDVSGAGITIYINGDLRVNGNPTINLSAPSRSPNPDPAIPGLLFYVTGDITVNGSSDQWYLGMVYAPAGYCKFNGTGGTWDTLHTQIVCWDVEVTGTADIDINFDAGVQ
jgi:hypothetical protein